MSYQGRVLSVVTVGLMMCLSIGLSESASAQAPGVPRPGDFGEPVFVEREYKVPKKFLELAGIPTSKGYGNKDWNDNKEEGVITYDPKTDTLYVTGTEELQKKVSEHVTKIWSKEREQKKKGQ